MGTLHDFFRQTEIKNNNKNLVITKIILLQTIIYLKQQEITKKHLLLSHNMSYLENYSSNLLQTYIFGLQGQ